MAWYKTGTVSIVNGATSVSGTGTRFAANARVGDGFRGPDGEWYEILNIASETTLGIFPAYSGATVSLSSEYMIAPLQGYNKETADRLRIITDGMSDISGDVEAAQAAAAAALNSETNAQSSEDAAKVSELAAKTSETNSALSEANASASELVALNSATAASNSEQAAALSETNALASENAAKVSEDAALASELAAKASASSASMSETNAQASEDAAKVSELAAKASELSADEDATTATTAATSASNSMTAAQAAQVIAEQARDDAIEAAGTVTGNLMDQGPWDASTGVYPTKPAVSSFWKVTGNGSATDAGETISYGIGDTLMFSKPLENFYKIDNTESVSSVNGHTGVVVLEKSDIGLSNVDNTSDIDKPISTSVNNELLLKIPKSDIVDNITTDDATKVLSAKQGKFLYDLVQSNNATAVSYKFITTAGQTTLSGVDSLGQTLTYTPGSAMLVTGQGIDYWDTYDYTATTGTSIVFTEPFIAGEEIGVVVFGTFSVADHYTKQQDDDKFVAKTQVIDVAHGGTGVTTLPALLSDLQSAGAYSKANSVGTVSQSAGVPTGAIVQRISNVNGQGIRLLDGTQIVWCITSVQTCATTAATGGFYNNSPCQVDYPISFISPPVAVATAVRPAAAGGYRITGSEVVDGTEATSPAYRGIATASTETIQFRVIAIGRWF